MRPIDRTAVQRAAMEASSTYFDSLDTRAVYRPTDPAELRALLDGPLPQTGEAPDAIISALAKDLDPYLTAFSSGRFFGFVIGGTHPAGYGAELMAAAWDQNVGLYAPTPGVAMIEEITAGWLLDVLALPSTASVGFVTGGQMANFTCLAAARHAVLRAADWDVEHDGLIGAPPVTVIVKSEVHVTVRRALRFLGLGANAAVVVPSDEQARMDVEALDGALTEVTGPTIVCLEAGDVNTGSFDDFRRIAPVIERHRARGNPTWVHVDGAVGLWARGAASTAHLVDGMESCDSWSTDAHKLLNVAYDSGIAICADAAAHRAAMSITASYLMQEDVGARDPMDYNPEFSRRARGLGVYATMRSLGRDGIDELVTTACAMAQRFATSLPERTQAKIVNDVVFNQVLVRWVDPAGDNDGFADRVIARIQADGTAFFGGTTYRGERLMRISVSDHATDADDVDRALEALVAASQAEERT